MTYQEWKSLKSTRCEDAKKVIRDFERNNPEFQRRREREVM